MFDERDVLENPGKAGFLRVMLTRKDHNQIFTKMPTRFGFYYEYYMSADQILVFTFLTTFAKILNFLFIPITVLKYGFDEAPEIWEEFTKDWNQRKSGNFVVDNAQRGSATYKTFHNYIRKDK